jgi:hypothetical protein
MRLSAKPMQSGILWVLLLIWGAAQSGDAPTIVTVASGAEWYGSFRLNNNDEVVWSQRIDRKNDPSTIWSNKRGQISFNNFSHNENHPDINDAGEVIWRFGDGGQGPDGIESNIRGLIYYEQSNQIDPYYDTNRINNNGEIVWSRPIWTGSFWVDEIWSNVRGRLTYSGYCTHNRRLAINDAGEVVYVSYRCNAPETNYFDIFSTERGQITRDWCWDRKPDISNRGEIVWERDIDCGGDDWQIWSTEKGQVTDNGRANEHPSVNDNGEIVWQYWDGRDYEIMSSVRGPITRNNSDDTLPKINNRGTIVWKSECWGEGDCAILAIFGNDMIDITIDVKPGSDRNPINLRSKGNTPVAILSSNSFDATQVDWETVRFGPSGATERHYRVHITDVDGDGDMDAKLHFKTRDTGINCGDTEATLTGETFSGDAFTGTDSVNTVKCPKRKRR